MGGASIQELYRSSRHSRLPQKSRSKFRGQTLIQQHQRLTHTKEQTNMAKTKTASKKSSTGASGGRSKKALVPADPPIIVCRGRSHLTCVRNYVPLTQPPLSAG